MSRKFWSFKSFIKQKQPEIKVDKDELKKKLTPLQYRVTQDKATERPFSGEYLKLKENGMYTCIVCDQELFSSTCKYDSGCGWPAFFDAQDTDKLILKADLSHVGSNLILLALKPDLARTEVTCGKCGSHLGHVFDDGPKPTGLRYCINSAALKFTKVDEISQDGSKEGQKGGSALSTKLCDSKDCSVQLDHPDVTGNGSFLKENSTAPSASTLAPKDSSLVSDNNNIIEPVTSQVNEKRVDCKTSESPGNLRHKLRMEFYYGTSG